MKKLWVVLLALLCCGAMLLAAVAEDAEVFCEPAEEYVPEAAEFTLGEDEPANLSSTQAANALDAEPGAETGDGAPDSEIMASPIEDFEIDENGVLVKYNGPGGDVVVPEGVTAIGDSAFAYCTELKSIEIPGTVLSIGSDAFAYSGLHEVVLHEGLPIIGPSAFCYVGATRITIPETVTKIGEYAFSMSGLISITIPKSVTEIGAGAFYNSALTDLFIEGDAITLGDALVGDSYYDCTIHISCTCAVTGLENTDWQVDKKHQEPEIVPAVEPTLTEPGLTEGQKCPACGEFVVPQEVVQPPFQLENGILVHYNGTDDDPVIPDGIIGIGYDAFSGHPTLKSVTIPASVTSIDYDAFSGCDALMVIHVVKPDSFASKWALVHGYTTDPDIGIENGIVLWYGGSDDDVVIPDGVTGIQTEAFQFHPTLKSVTIPTSVTDINEYAFTGINASDVVIYAGRCGSYAAKWGREHGFTVEPAHVPQTDAAVAETDTAAGLTEGSHCSVCGEILVAQQEIPSHFTIENGVVTKYVGPGEDAEIPDGVTGIGPGAFSGYVGLKSVTIPASVTAIGEKAFADCGPIAVVVKEGMTAIGDYMFANGSMTSVKLPKSVTVIGEYAFHGCDGLTDIEIPDGVTEIKEAAFERCAMTEITIPQSVTKIGSAAFFDCRQLKTITLSSNLTSIGREAFFGCRKLETIKFSDDVTSICDNMFQDCSSLTSLEIPNSVNYIGNSSFEACTGLTTVTIAPNVSIQPSVPKQDDGGPAVAAPAATDVVIGNRAFKGCTYMTQIYIPANVTSIADNAFDSCPDLTIYGEAGSAAEHFAKGHGIPFVSTDGKKSIGSCKITVANKTYTGKALKPAPTVTYINKKLKKNRDYTVSYKNNKKIGAASVTITGKGDYAGAVTVSFKIVPKGTTLSKLTAGSKQIGVSWKKQAKNVTGYQIEYSLKKSFANGKKLTVKKAGTTSATIKKLKGNKTYYVRVRTYKTVKGKKYYSAWSKAKKVVTKG